MARRRVSLVRLDRVYTECTKLEEVRLDGSSVPSINWAIYRERTFRVPLFNVYIIYRFWKEIICEKIFVLKIKGNAPSHEIYKFNNCLNFVSYTTHSFEEFSTAVSRFISVYLCFSCLFPTHEKTRCSPRKSVEPTSRLLLDLTLTLRCTDFGSVFHLATSSLYLSVFRS